MESTKVLIVGGGVAGLAAAKTLGADVNYILVEAQHYLGGRILTVDASNETDMILDQTLLVLYLTSTKSHC